MDVQAKLAELRGSVDGARSMPMSASVMVNRSELLALIDELSGALESAFVDSQRVISERDSAVDGGRQEADRIVADARSEREKIISDTDVYRVARREADGIVERARVEADALRQETDEYVDAKLANFEITLERTTEAVKRGRARLAGRSAFEGITADEADKITLPDHLDG